jgi:RNA polymerase sigma factor (sigma-70 family)
MGASSWERQQRPRGGGRGGEAAVTAFKNPALKQLTDQQVRFAPAGRRLEQKLRAEKLLAEIEPSRQYPYQFVCFRVTDFRPESYPDLLIPGIDLQHDLALMIVALGVPADEGADGPLLLLDEVSKRLNVSTKTIRRWEKLGLVGKRVLCNGRYQLAYRQSVIDLFLAMHHDRADRGSRFSQMSDDERDDILRRAKRMSRLGAGLTEISRRIARRFGRSIEAVRYTIKRFDQEHPGEALFPHLTGPLADETKETIYHSYRRGIAVDTLAKRFGRTRTSVYRAINEIRARRLLSQPLDYIPHTSFDDPAMEPIIRAPMPDADEYEAKCHDMRVPRDVPAELASMYEVPLLSKDQEQHLFRKMNFLKYKAAQLRNQLRKEPGAHEIDPYRVRIQILREIEDLQAEANEVKDLLIKANMRLVVNITKRHSGQAENFWELISDGNMSLIRAVEKFDFGRGFKFSTYASWAIMKNFARSIPDEKHRRERFLTGHEDVFDIAPDNRSDEHEALATQNRATQSVNRLLEYLEPRERDIIRMRAGLDSHAKGMTLEEIGQQFGITKERVRQLNARAMKKLRSIAAEQHLDLS